MKCSVSNLELHKPTWQELELTINEELFAAQEQGLNILDFQVFENDGEVFLLIKTDSEYQTILVDEDIEDLF